MSFKKIFEENIKHPDHRYELHPSYLEILDEFVQMINEQTLFQITSKLIKTSKARYRLNLYAKFRPIIFDCLMSVVPKENNSIEIWNEDHIKCKEASSLRSYLEEVILNAELIKTMAYLEDKNKNDSVGKIKLTDESSDYIEIETDSDNQKKLFEFLNDPSITNFKIKTSRIDFLDNPNVDGRQFNIISSAGIEAKIEKIESEENNLTIWLIK